VRHIPLWTTPGSGLNPVTVVRQAMVRYPDELPSPQTASLSFVADQPLRHALRVDISSVNQALANGEWKAATVLAGSVIEALLMWALQDPARTAIVDASGPGGRMLAKARRYGSAATTPSAAFEDGALSEYLDIAAEIGLLQPRTLEQADIARDFRNLIHPGRAKRVGQVCDRGIALAAVGALEHVGRDLTPP